MTRYGGYEVAVGVRSFCFDMLAEHGAGAKSWWTFTNGCESASMVPLCVFILYHGAKGFIPQSHLRGFTLAVTFVLLVFRSESF